MTSGSLVMSLDNNVVTRVWIDGHGVPVIEAVEAVDKKGGWGAEGAV